MKKRVICFIIGMLLAAQSSMTVSAAPAIMPDGELFDAEYYAEHNPDVVAAIGTDMHALYAHYQQSGILEGRQPYVPGTNVEATKAAALAVSILDSKDLPEGVYRLKGYNELPVFAGTLWQPVRDGNDVYWYTNGQRDGSIRASDLAHTICDQILKEEESEELIQKYFAQGYRNIRWGFEEELVELGEFKVIDGFPNNSWKAGSSNGMLVSKLTRKFVKTLN